MPTASFSIASTAALRQRAQPLVGDRQAQRRQHRQPPRIPHQPHRRARERVGQQAPLARARAPARASPRPAAPGSRPARSAARTSRSSDQRHASPSSSPRARRSATAAASSRAPGLVLLHLAPRERPRQLARPGRQRHLAEIEHREARRRRWSPPPARAAPARSPPRARPARAPPAAAAAAPRGSGRSGSGSASDETPTPRRRAVAGQRAPPAPRSQPAAEMDALRPRLRRQPQQGARPRRPGAAARPTPEKSRAEHNGLLRLMSPGPITHRSSIIKQPRFDRDLDADINGRPCCACRLRNKVGPGRSGLLSTEVLMHVRPRQTSTSRDCARCVRPPSLAKVAVHRRRPGGCDDRISAPGARAASKRARRSGDFPSRDGLEGVRHRQLVGGAGPVGPLVRARHLVRAPAAAVHRRRHVGTPASRTRSR